MEETTTQPQPARKSVFWSVVMTCLVFVLGAAAATAYFVVPGYLAERNRDTSSPWIESLFEEPKYTPYAIRNLKNYPLETSQIVATEQVEQTDEYVRYMFSYTTTGKQMSGMLTVPTETDLSDPAIIVMNRGYIPTYGYESGDGTNPSSARYATAGFVTVAIDFLGVGDSDPAREDVWLGRFEKPIQVMELIKSIETSGITVTTDDTSFQISPTTNIALWGHSNGGQITLATLAGFNLDVPATIWAPVTAPFPYSLLFFSDTDADEGKGTRKFISLFEEEYDVFEYSVTQQVDQLRGPLTIHHGSADMDALKAWSDRFAAKVAAENESRREAAENASPSAAVLEPIEFTYYEYPGADHNLRPAWETVVERDIEYFTEYLR